MPESSNHAASIASPLTGPVAECWSMALVDQHCHAVRTDDLDRTVFETLCSESPYPAGAGSHLDGPVGWAIRRWCPPLLGLPAFAPWDDYLARRFDIGGAEVTRRMVAGARQSALLIDTGYRGDELCSLGEMAAFADAPVREIVRVEVVAEELAARVGAAEFIDTFMEVLTARAVEAVGLKSVLAYRCGFDVDLLAVDASALRTAVTRWIEGGAPAQALRLDDPVIEAFVVRCAARVAAARGIPMQFHVGYGDPDVVLHRANPSLLTPFIEWCRPLGTRIVLLHCWPYEREAGFLATVFPHVWMDVGLALNYLGPSAPAFLARALECTPYPKVLYSSDAFGLPELYAAGAAQFRWSLAQVLDGWVTNGDLPVSEALAAATAIAAHNATSLYDL